MMGLCSLLYYLGNCLGGKESRGETRRPSLRVAKDRIGENGTGWKGRVRCRVSSTVSVDIVKEVVKIRKGKNKEYYYDIDLLTC